MAVLLQPKLAKSIIEKAKEIHAQEVQKIADNPIKSRLAVVERKLETLTERLSELPRGISAEPIYAQMKKLTDEKSELTLKNQDRDLNQPQPRMPAYMNTYTLLIEKITRLNSPLGTIGADAKARIIKALVHSVDVTENGIRVNFYAGDQELRRATEGPAGGSIGVEKNLFGSGSNSLLNGA